MIQRAIISGGGTGGHIFPAVSIAEALRRRYPDIDILFIGAEGRMEMERVPQAGFPIRGLKIRGLDRKRPWRNIGVLRDFLRALITARQCSDAEGSAELGRTYAHPGAELLRGSDE